METVSLCALVISFACLQSAHGSAINRQSLWLNLAEDVLLREKRNVDDDNTTLASDGYNGGCQSQQRCTYGDAYLDNFKEVFGDFRLAQVYENTDNWCNSSPDGCWDDDCQSLFLRRALELRIALVGFICTNRLRFRDAATCFQDPFREIMEPCVEFSGPVADRLTKVRACVRRNISGMTSCTTNDKAFFLEMIDFVTNEAATMMAI